MGTVCKRCENMVVGPCGGKYGPPWDVWYNLTCKAYPRKKVVCPLTGKDAYEGVNDLGNAYTTDEPYDYCRNHNQGNCSAFKEKSTGTIRVDDIQCFVNLLPGDEEQDEEQRPVYIPKKPTLAERYALGTFYPVLLLLLAVGLYLTFLP